MWRVGIDEAGYGPNLGPLVMTLVACRIPDEQAQTCLWQLLAKAVRKGRTHAKHKHKLLIDDSKNVYSPTRGLADLLRSVLAVLPQFATLAEFVHAVHPDSDLPRECWYTGTTPLPDHASERTLLADVCAENGARFVVLSRLICPRRFNGIVDRLGSKGAVLGMGLVELTRAFVEAHPDEDVDLVGDKQGGRNQYGPYLQEVFNPGWVSPRQESMELSEYEVTGLPRKVRVRMMPRADGEHFSVALASMVSKLLRELAMAEFNGYWQTLLPALEPTAGYPLDAGRYYAAIEPVMQRLQIPRNDIWRER